MDPRRGARTPILTRVGVFLLMVPVLLLVATLVLLSAPFWLAAGAYYLARGRWLRRQFRREFAAQGTPVILVYSDSPHWRDYFDEQIIPLLGDRGVVLNWSERRHWKSLRSLPIRVYQHHKPDREFNPYALVFGPKGPPEQIPFFLAFRELRRGKPLALEGAVADFWSKLEAASRAWDLATE